MDKPNMLKLLIGFSLICISSGATTTEVSPTDPWDGSTSASNQYQGSTTGSGLSTSTDGVTGDLTTTGGDTQNQTTPDGMTQNETFTDGLTTDQATTDEITPDQPTTDGVTQDQATTDEMTPDQPTTNGVTQDQATTDGMTPDQPTTNGVTQDQATTDGMTPDQATSDGMTPDQPTTNGTEQEITTLGSTDKAETTQKPTTPAPVPPTTTRPGQAQTPDLGDETVDFGVNILLDAPWKDDYGKPNSPVYKEFEFDVLKDLDAVYRNTSSDELTYVSVHIFNFTREDSIGENKQLKQRRQKRQSSESGTIINHSALFSAQSVLAASPADITGFLGDAIDSMDQIAGYTADEDFKNQSKQMMTENVETTFEAACNSPCEYLDNPCQNTNPNKRCIQLETEAEDECPDLRCLSPCHDYQLEGDLEELRCDDSTQHCKISDDLELEGECRCKDDYLPWLHDDSSCFHQDWLIGIVAGVGGAIIAALIIAVAILGYKTGSAASKESKGLLTDEEEVLHTGSYKGTLSSYITDQAVTLKGMDGETPGLRKEMVESGTKEDYMSTTFKPRDQEPQQDAESDYASVVKPPSRPSSNAYVNAGASFSYDNHAYTGLQAEPGYPDPAIDLHRDSLGYEKVIDQDEAFFNPGLLDIAETDAYKNFVPQLEGIGNRGSQEINFPRVKLTQL